MNEDNAAEKLDIVPEKIIHILLKHLMYLKNENAYIKNNVGLQMADTTIAEKSNGVKSAPNAIAEKSNGVNSVPNAVPEKSNGVKSAPNAIAEKSNGVNSVPNAIAEKSNGVNSVPNTVPEKGNGVNSVPNTISEIGNGVNSLIEGISTLNIDTNGGVLLYSVFEQGLIDALNQYIKNGNGQNSLYDFYTNFVEAVEQKNTEAAKLKEAILNLLLEDTHFLPLQIAVDNVSLAKLKSALHAYFPLNARGAMYETIARELLLLHNSGKVNGAKLREAGGLSIAGFSKHLPRLKKYVLVKSEPPSNYVLTEKSIHILLKTFGIPKNK